MSDDFEQKWLYVGEKQRGSQFDYTDQAILVMLTVKEIFHLTNRGVEGFVRSLFRLMKVNLPVPDHSTLSKRGKDSKVKLPRHRSVLSPRSMSHHDRYSPEMRRTPSPTGEIPETHSSNGY